MVPRVLIGVLALAGAAVCGLLSTTAIFEMVNQVNEKLAKEDPFAEFGWHLPKNRTSPSRVQEVVSPWATLTPCPRTWWLDVFSLLICAGSFGFFS